MKKPKAKLCMTGEERDVRFGSSGARHINPPTSFFLSSLTLPHSWDPKWLNNAHMACGFSRKAKSSIETSYD
jgi:hypothetical protein